MLWLVMGNKSFKGIPVSDLSHLPPKDYAQKLSFNKWACRFNFGFSCVIITFSKKRYNLQAGVNFLTNMCTIISEHIINSIWKTEKMKGVECQMKSHTKRGFTKWALTHTLIPSLLISQ